jgi:hypothetical protein
MNKPKKSLTESERESTTPLQSLTKLYGSPETLTDMRRMEAREWIRRYRAKVKESGSTQARGWWDGVISDIEKIRGKDSATQLRYWMNQEK